ncbi:class I SAM-dependent methyltransferase [Polyangium jinanense]|uniref:S-adenosyl-L-methionine-dependent methyltransferase n=1 Tax=Polyangium jinanense TaxID=2829994 RepID=A0A9X3WZ14_9BACT|nr:SAM-dependent methyltransferase [Polyangium jinanense]MDC3954384.1 SAM-dependent methyltransferase [Polyangium jinanense]MDC3980687.1 SAM-dependent methyltransferase [Polyangium jinanense]
MPHERPSLTAKKIARFLILIDAVPRFAGLLPADAATTVEAILRASGAVGRRQIDMMRAPWTQRFYEIAEAWTARGQLIWFGLRKRWMADAVEEAIAAGATQLLVVGAGFDPLATIVARRHPEVTCVEIDAPATAAPKRAGVRGAGFERTNLHICAADLSKRSLGEILRATPWRSDARSVVVAEGLLMYLDVKDVKAFFRAVHEHTGPGSRVAFSHVDGDDAGRPHLGTLDWLIRTSLRFAGEQMRWGIRPEQLPAFVKEAGFLVVEQADGEALRKEYLAPIGLPEEPVAAYEVLALVERAEARG